MKKKFCIITDSSTILDESLQKNNLIKIISLSIILPNNKVLQDDHNLSDDYFYNILRNNHIKTSQTPIGITEQCWSKYLEEYEKLIVIGISSGISSQYKSSLNLSKTPKFKNKVFVIDNKGASIILNEQIHFALNIIQKNPDEFNLKEFEKKIKRFTTGTKGLIFPKSLETLKRGGRISPAVAAIGNLIKVTPVLTFNDGKIKKYSKIRTYVKGITKTIEKTKNQLNANVISISYSTFDDENIIIALKKNIKELNFKKVKYSKTPKVILAHLGINVFEVFLWKE